MCFVEAVEELARKAGCKLTVCPQAENRNDRWIQVSSVTGGPTRIVSCKEIPRRTQGLPDSRVLVPKFLFPLGKVAEATHSQPTAGPRGSLSLKGTLGSIWRHCGCHTGLGKGLA